MIEFPEIFTYYALHFPHYACVIIQYFNTTVTSMSPLLSITDMNGIG